MLFSMPYKKKTLAMNKRVYQTEENRESMHNMRKLYLVSDIFCRVGCYPSLFTTISA